MGEAFSTATTAVKDILSNDVIQYALQIGGMLLAANIGWRIYRKIISGGV
jgi:hypothetical protein